MAVLDSNTTIHLVASELENSDGLNAVKTLLTLSEQQGEKVATPLPSGSPIVAGTRYGVLVTVSNQNTTEGRTVSGTDYLNPAWFTWGGAVTTPSNLLLSPATSHGSVSFSTDTATLNPVNLGVLQDNPTVFYYFEVVCQVAPIGTLALNKANIYDSLTDANYDTNEVQHPIVSVQGVYPTALTKSIDPVPGESGLFVKNVGVGEYFEFHCVVQDQGGLLQSKVDLKDVLDPNLSFIQFKGSAVVRNRASFDPFGNTVFWYVDQEPQKSLIVGCEVKEGTPIGTVITNVFQTEEEISPGVPYNESNPVVITVVDSNPPVPSKVVMTKNAIAIENAGPIPIPVFDPTLERGDTFAYTCSITPVDAVNGFSGEIEDIFPVGVRFIGMNFPEAANVLYDVPTRKLTFDIDIDEVVNFTMNCLVESNAPSGVALNELVHDPNGVNDRSNPAPITISPDTDLPIDKRIKELGLLTGVPLAIIPDNVPVLKISSYVAEVLVINPTTLGRSLDFEDDLAGTDWVFDSFFTSNPYPAPGTLEQTVLDLSYDAGTKKVSKASVYINPGEVNASGFVTPSLTRILFKVKPYALATPGAVATNQATLGNSTSNMTSNPVV